MYIKKLPLNMLKYSNKVQICLIGEATIEENNTMASSPKRTLQLEDNNISVTDTGISNDIEENLTFTQLIKRYCMSTNDDDATIIQSQSQSDDTTLTIAENTDARIAQNLWNYLEKECFPETQ